MGPMTKERNTRTQILGDDIIRFWFQETDKKKWFQGDEAFDQEIRQRFSEVHTAAANGELFSWRHSAEGRLAEIIILDQFSRNIFREDARAFAQEPLALVLAQEMVERGIDQSLPVEWRAFAYMPFMHSESLLIHEEASRLFSTPGLEDNLRFEKLHADILRRFGRYPHRNKVLGRKTTPEEAEFLKTPGSSF
jgi:uncharacterized protein (DUF924 family)